MINILSLKLRASFQSHILDIYSYKMYASRQSL